MESDAIKKDLAAFQVSIKKLSHSIGQAGTLWRDSKYAELSSSASDIANQSRDVLVAGESCCLQIDKFEKIASEKY